MRDFKQLYAITPEGERTLRSWLDSREQIPGVRRDGLLLKLFFGANADPTALREQIVERKRRAADQLAALEQIEREIDRDADFFPYLTLLHGLEDARSVIEQTPLSPCSNGGRERRLVRPPERAAGFAAAALAVLLALGCGANAASKRPPVVATIRTGIAPIGLAAGSLWVSNQASSTVSRIRY